MSANSIFDERLGMLVDPEWFYRENKRMARCLKEAKLLLGQACIEDIGYPARRELDRAVIRQLVAKSTTAVRDADWAGRPSRRSSEISWSRWPARIAAGGTPAFATC